MDKDTRNIVTTAIAAAVTVALPFLRVHPLVALLFGVAAFFLAREVIPVSESLESGESDSLPETTGQVVELDATNAPLAVAARAATRFRESAEGIEREATAETVREIARTVDQLIQDFREDPADLKLPAAQTFLNTNLDRALRLVETYARLSSMEPLPELDPRARDRQRSLSEAEEAIEMTLQGFQALLGECQDNDLRQMDMDSHVLTQMLEDRFPQLAAAERRALERQPDEAKADGGSGDSGKENS